MLQQITWTTYFETLGLTSAIYYGLIAFKFYAVDIMLFFQTRLTKNGGQETAQIPFFAPEKDDVQEEEYETRRPDAALAQFEDSYEDGPDTTMQEADTMIASVKSVIKEASSIPFNPPALVHKIKSIFMDSESIKNSPHRDAINELVVAECERNGTALLTEEEVDHLWND